MAGSRVKEIGLHFLGTVFRMIASAGSSILLGWLLGPADQGIFSYGFWMAMTIASLSAAAAGQTLIRFGLTDAKVLDRRVGRILYVVALVICSLLGACVLVLNPQLFPDGTSPAILWGIIGLCFAAAASQFELAALRCENRFAMASGLNLAYAGILLVGLVPAIKVFGINGSLVIFLLAELPAAARSLRFFRPASIKASLEAAALTKFFIFAELSAGIALLTWGQTELVFLKRTVSPEVFGFYTQALRFSVIPAQLLMFQLTYIYPLLVSLHKADRMQEVKRCYKAGTRLYLFSLGSASFLLAQTAKWWFPSIFGPSYAPGIPIAKLLFLVSISSVVAYSSPMAMTLGRSWLGSISNSIAFTILIAGNTIITPEYGVMGAGVVRGAALITAGIVELTAISLWLRDGRVMLDVVLTLIGVGMLTALMDFLDSTTEPAVSGAAAIGLSLLLAGTLWFAYRKDIMWIVHSVRNRKQGEAAA